ncbi:MAG: hypothetical protein K2X12_04010 [Burkholderiaceae bacterium]|nr:hypothetical protein [Burkholderiaceae bacterium]
MTDAPAERPSVLLPEDIAAKLNDLDEMVVLLRKAVPADKTWGRQLTAQLRNADGCVEVLRLTLLLHKPVPEVAAASSQVRMVIAAIDASAAGGRADLTTRLALVHMHRLAKTVDRHFQSLAERG